jgi:hypothetical protein
MTRTQARAKLARLKNQTEHPEASDIIEVLTFLFENLDKRGLIDTVPQPEAPKP